jgi:hypothetical protein
MIKLFQAENHIRLKMAISKNMKFYLLGFNVSYGLKEDINIKLTEFQRICGTKNSETKNVTKYITQIWKVVTVHMLTFTSGKLMINQSYKRKIESAEISFLHPYILLDISFLFDPEDLCSSEMSVVFPQTTLHCIPKNRTPSICRCVSSISDVLRECEAIKIYVIQIKMLDKIQFLV